MLKKTFGQVLVFLLFLLELVLLNNHNKNILENVYNISKKDQGPTWGGFHFQKKRSEKLERFVVNNLDSEEQLEKLITILYKEAESRKFSGIFIRGLGIGLFLPLWNFFVRSGFESGVNNINDAFALFIILVYLSC